MAEYIAKPLTIEAFRWTGGPDQTEDPGWIVREIEAGRFEFHETGYSFHGILNVGWGLVMVNPGDYIIKNPDGQLSTMKPHIFKATYDEVPNGDT